MIPDEHQTFFTVARWTATHRNRRSRIREFFQKEENYLRFIRELERVEDQRMCAQKQRAPASLTLIEWLKTLEYFRWQCAYCRSKPFQVMHHYQPLREAGTTVANCVPACRRCRALQKGEHEAVRLYLSQFHQEMQTQEQGDDAAGETNSSA